MTFVKGSKSPESSAERLPLGELAFADTMGNGTSKFANAELCLR